MSIQKVKIKKVATSTQSKDGIVYRDQKGIQKYRVAIQVAEYGEKWLSDFMYKVPVWKEGDEVELEIEQKGEYLNFRVPKAEKVDAKSINDRLNAIETKLGKIDFNITIIKEAMAGKVQIIPKPETPANYPKNTGPMPFEDVVEPSPEELNEAFNKF